MIYRSSLVCESIPRIKQGVRWGGVSLETAGGNGPSESALSEQGPVPWDAAEHQAKYAGDEHAWDPKGAAVCIILFAWLEYSILNKQQYILCHPGCMPVKVLNLPS